MLGSIIVVRVLLGVCLLLPAALVAAQPDEAAARCMALNLYWEARSEGREGMVAVGWVVLNRVAYAKYPNTICEVIQQGGQTPPCQWNWWCDGRSDEPKESASWKLAQEVAQQILHHPPADPTHGALWFSSRIT